MFFNRFTARYVVALVIFLTFLACGPSPEPDKPTPIPTSIVEVTKTPMSTHLGLAVKSLEEAPLAVIRIEVTGSFVEPEQTLTNAKWGGTGFIISPDGIAVTNAHVVNGGGNIEVYVNGESQPRSARVLGLSECSDLAVLQLEGDDYHYMQWHEGNIGVGMEVYTAGYPLATEEYTLTKGIISQRNADGESSWASVRNVLMHDATINPGNSGGPLVTAEGRVVGINYASSSETGQFFAISRDEALDLIEDLQAGNDITAIGINGTAIYKAGIWVSAVSSGSPAARTGIKPGDIILSLEDVFLGGDGTMAEYCKTLRSHNANEIMKARILRFATEQVLVGELNGEPFQPIPPLPTLEPPSGNQRAYDEYTTVTDDSGSIQVKIPTAWSDVNLSIPRSDSDFNAAISASPNLDDFSNGWSAPGLFFGATTKVNMTVDEALDKQDFSESCSHEERKPYEDDLYVGKMDIWAKCGGTNTTLVVVSVTPENKNFLALLQVQLVSEADLDAWEQIWRSFVVDDSLSQLSQDDALAESSETPPPLPARSGPASFQLWSNNLTGWLNGGQDAWYTFNSGQDSEATLIAFVENTDQFEMELYQGKDIPAWPPANPLPANLGLGTKDGNRDGNDKTVEYIWQGPLPQHQKFYLRLVNRGGASASYCIVTRPDKYSCP